MLTYNITIDDLTLSKDICQRELHISILHPQTYRSLPIFKDNVINSSKWWPKEIICLNTRVYEFKIMENIEVTISLNDLYYPNTPENERTNQINWENNVLKFYTHKESTIDWGLIHSWQKGDITVTLIGKD